MREEDVTRLLALHLSRSGWKVITTHHPGAQGGVYVLRDPRPKPPTKGAVVLDLVAKRGQVYLLVECKDRYYRPDALKVRALAADPAYRPSLAERFRIGWQRTPRLLGAIALPDAARLPRRLPEGVLVLAVGQCGLRVVAGQANVMKG